MYMFVYLFVSLYEQNCTANKKVSENEIIDHNLYISYIYSCLYMTRSMYWLFIYLCLYMSRTALQTRRQVKMKLPVLVSHSITFQIFDITTLIIDIKFKTRHMVCPRHDRLEKGLNVE
jgi:hypothetical protein